MTISFGHHRYQREWPWTRHGLALLTLFLTLFFAATFAFAQQAPDAVAPTPPAEISKGSPPAMAQPDSKGAAASSGPSLQTHPSPAANANAQRAARQPGQASASGSEDAATAQDPAAQPKRATPQPRLSPAQSP